MQRSRSTLARLTRSVSKLGGSRGSRGRADGAGPAAAEAAPQPPPPRPAAFRSGRELSAAGGGTGGSQANVATTTAARIKLFEQGTFNLEADLGSLSGEPAAAAPSPLPLAPSSSTAAMRAAQPALARIAARVACAVTPCQRGGWLPSGGEQAAAPAAPETSQRAALLLGPFLRLAGFSSQRWHKIMKTYE
jgi:hypothetical protein